jgi:hypothetical protein
VVTKRVSPDTKIVSPKKIRQFQVNREKRAARGPSALSYNGIIKKTVEAGKLIIVSKNEGMFTKGEEKAFLIENAPKITKNRREIPFTELEEGIKVSVSYIVRENRMIVTAINVIPAKGVSEILKLKRVRAKSE